MGVRSIMGLMIGVVIISWANQAYSERGIISEHEKKLSEQYYNLGRNYYKSALICAKEPIRIGVEDKKTKESECITKMANGYSALLVAMTMGATDFVRIDGDIESLEFTLSTIVLMIGTKNAFPAYIHATNICDDIKGGWCRKNNMPLFSKTTNG